MFPGCLKLARTGIDPPCLRTRAPQHSSAGGQRRALSSAGSHLTARCELSKSFQRMNQTLKKLLGRPRPPRSWSAAFRHRGYYLDVRGLSVNEGASVVPLSSRPPAFPLLRVHGCTQEEIVCVCVCTRRAATDWERKGGSEGRRQRILSRCQAGTLLKQVGMCTLQGKGTAGVTSFRLRSWAECASSDRLVACVCACVSGRRDRRLRRRPLPLQAAGEQV